LAEEAAARAERAEHVLTDAIDRWVQRVTGVVAARLRGPRARRGTRHWSDRVKSADSCPDSVGSRSMAHLREGNGRAGTTSTTSASGLELKALDPDYLVPDPLIAEITDALRPAVERVAHEAAGNATARIVGGTSRTGGMFAVDEHLLGSLIEDALGELLGGAQRYAGELRAAIVEGERDGLPLDELLDRVEEAARRGGNWLRLNGRTLGTALAGQATLAQARALGVTTTQWISRRDERVRHSHRVADGQVRPVGEPFTVGGFALEYPGDPSGLPATAAVVHNCRCGLLLADPADTFLAALVDIGEAARTDDQPHAHALLEAAAASMTYAFPRPEDEPDTVTAIVRVPEDVVAWRGLDAPLEVTPGQQVLLPSGLALALSRPAQAGADMLAVLIPATTEVGVAGGALVLLEPATLAVLAVGAAGVQGQLLAAAA